MRSFKRVNIVGIQLNKNGTDGKLLLGDVSAWCEEIGVGKRQDQISHAQMKQSNTSANHSVSN